MGLEVEHCNNNIYTAVFVRFDIAAMWRKLYLLHVRSFVMIVTVAVCQNCVAVCVDALQMNCYLSDAKAVK